jgi:predicted oxidoreductase (fatty acid repression mutant protein)
MTDEFLTALKNRHSVYSIGAELPVTRERIQYIAEEALIATPSAFNSQSARLVLLFGAHHQQLWSIVTNTLRKLVPAENFAPTEAKLASFAGGGGTILFFDDTDVTADLMSKSPRYADTFPIWAQQANGMLQSNIWTALTAEGMGASLQHYNPLIDAEVKAQWKLPEGYLLISQMPFGNIIQPAEQKQNIPAAERIRVYK